MKKYTTTCYSYDWQTGAYNGDTIAYLDPMTPNQFNLPANATFEVPPADDGTNWPFWNGAAWELKPLDVQQ